jgi:hypothetical protein
MYKKVQAECTQMNAQGLVIGQHTLEEMFIVVVVDTLSEYQGFENQMQ